VLKANWTTQCVIYPTPTSHLSQLRILVPLPLHSSLSYLHLLQLHQSTAWLNYIPPYKASFKNITEIRAASSHILEYPQWLVVLITFKCTEGLRSGKHCTSYAIISKYIAQNRKLVCSVLFWEG
jgi:hypothetical protein